MTCHTIKEMKSYSCKRCSSNSKTASNQNHQLHR